VFRRAFFENHDGSEIATCPRSGPCWPASDLRQGDGEGTEEDRGLPDSAWCGNHRKYSGKVLDVSCGYWDRNSLGLTKPLACERAGAVAIERAHDAGALQQIRGVHTGTLLLGVQGHRAIGLLGRAGMGMGTQFGDQALKLLGVRVGGQDVAARNPVSNPRLRLW